MKSLDDDVEPKEIPTSPSSTNLKFDSLLELRRILRPDNFESLVYHVTVGNQVVVRGDVSTLVKSILDLLKELVPPTCVTMMPFESTYQESYKCNFLGLSAAAEIPTHVDRNTYVLLDMRYDNDGDLIGNGNLNYEQQLGKFLFFS